MIAFGFTSCVSTQKASANMPSFAKHPSMKSLVAKKTLARVKSDMEAFAKIEESGSTKPRLTCTLRDGRFVDTPEGFEAAQKKLVALQDVLWKQKEADEAFIMETTMGMLDDANALLHVPVGDQLSLRGGGRRQHPWQ